MSKPIPPMIEKITPRIATTMLIAGLLPEDDAESLRPANLDVEMIARLLHDANTIRNRTIKMNAVERYARDMTNGKWIYTGDPIKISKEGFVTDGQHRLLAIVKSGVTTEFAVQRGLDPLAQRVVDTGVSRSARDHLRIHGLPNYANAGAGMSLWLRWKAGRILDSSYQPTVTEITDAAMHNPNIQDACTSMMRVRHYLRYAPAAALVASYVEASEIDVDLRDEFFDKLAYGNGLSQGEPVGTLRLSLGRYKPEMPVRFGARGLFWMIIHSWNKTRKHEQIRTLRVPPSLTSKSFPEMI